VLAFDELAPHLIRHRKDLAAAKIGTNNLTSHLNASFHHLSAIDPHDLSGIAAAIFIDEAQTKSGPQGKKPQALHGFRPERLRGAAITPFNVIPQRGGGGSLTKPPFPPRKDFDCADADRDEHACPADVLRIASPELKRRL
jgi:hypothetical protein